MVVAWGIVVVFGLEDALVAVVGLALIAAAVPLARLAADTARMLPWPIYLVADLAVSAVERAIGGAVAWSAAGAQGIADVIQLPWQAIWTVARESVAASEHLYWAVWRVYELELPALYQWAQQTIAGAEAAAFAFTQAQVSALAHYLQAVEVALIGRMDAETAQLGAELSQLAQLEGAYAQQLAAAAIEHADQDLVLALQHTDAGLESLTAYVQAAVHDAINLEVLEAQQLTLELERVEQLGIDFTRQMGGDLVRDLAAGVAAAEAFAAAAVAGVAVRVQELEDSPCQRACGPLGQIGGLLQSLEDAGLVAILLGLAQQAQQHPDQVAQELAGVFVPIAHDAAASLQLGIPG